MMRFSQPRKSLSKPSPTLRSDSVWPGLSTLVESDSSASTPCLPSSPKRVRSIISPLMGVRSILKSPVWITTPSGVWMASATESVMLWFT